VALKTIVAEMEEGLTGAKRSVATATASEGRLRKEIAEQQTQVENWTAEARRELASGREDAARLALERKQEVVDVIAGLEQQHKAATATRDHLTTTLRALEARIADARRRMRDYDAQMALGTAHTASGGRSSAGHPEESSRTRLIDEELESLKRELGRG
jgi:phage shock protein A